MKRTDFSEPFYWGVSTAAPQIEGAWNEDGRGPSIWDVFSARRGKIYQNQSPRIACDFYHRYEVDIQILKILGIPDFRFSLSWSRILPEGNGQVNQTGLDFYKRLIDRLLEENIRPWITLYHWDLPQALENQGGWTRRSILGAFEDFAQLAGKELMHREVEGWMVLNEPLVFTGAGHFLGYHAPGRRGFSNFIPAMLHAALATSLGEKVLRTFDSKAKIGSTYSCSFITPKTEKEADLKAARKADAMFNRLYIEPALGLGFPLDDLPILRPVEKIMKAEDEANLPANLDFIGVQNYTREVVESCWYVPYLGARLVNAKKRNVPHTEMQWEVYPEALYQMLKKFGAYRPEIPMIVTENGAAFPDHWEGGNVVDDPRRLQYLQDHIKQVLKAKEEGLRVEGYFVWTLIDNFEWAEGFRPRFGLVYLDLDSQQRVIKNSGWWYRNFLVGENQAYQEFMQGHSSMSM